MSLSVDGINEHFCTRSTDHRHFPVHVNGPDISKMYFTCTYCGRLATVSMALIREILAWRWGHDHWETNPIGVALSMIMGWDKPTRKTKKRRRSK